jgi:hypothetical protein
MEEEEEEGEEGRLMVFASTGTSLGAVQHRTAPHRTATA